ncbi:MAG: arylesterase [Magnetospiraceae bacterium]
MKPMLLAYGVWRALFNVGVILAVFVGTPALAAEPMKLLLIGDSLTAGYGLPASDGFAEQLATALEDAGETVTVINAGVSGDTTAGGLARLDWTLAEKPDAVVLELGANDGLRGVDPAVTRDNLDAMLKILGDKGIPVLLAGMLAPPNLGRSYGDEFNRIFPEMADQHDVPLYPFFLEGVAAISALNQSDGIHPNAEGVAIIVRNILPHVRELLEQARE